MKTNITPIDYKGFRFPSEMISHTVWLYFRFSLSFRDVEGNLAQR
jgi:putative transposase